MTTGHANGIAIDRRQAYPILAGVSPARQGAHLGELARCQDIEGGILDTEVGVVAQAVDHLATAAWYRADEHAHIRTVTATMPMRSLN